MRQFGLVFCFMFLGSCASAPVAILNWYEGDEYQFETDTVVNASLDQVRDRLISGLARTQFSIEKKKKKSGYLNLSFEIGNDVSEYVDCGMGKVIFNLHGKTEVFEYPAAEDSAYKSSASRGSFDEFTWYENVVRDTKVSGRVNVLLSPNLHDKSTNVSVSARYTWSVIEYRTVVEVNVIRSTETNIRGYATQPIEVAFSSDEKGLGPDLIFACASKGKLEAEILSLLK